MSTRGRKIRGEDAQAGKGQSRQEGAGKTRTLIGREIIRKRVKAHPAVGREKGGKRGRLRNSSGKIVRKKAAGRNKGEAGRIY